MLRRLAAPVTVAAALLVGGAITLAPRPAAAFCGFYVAGADADLYNNATVVVLMRSGTRTVMSMQNDYQGPPEGFALVIPVPVLLKESDVKVLRRELFDRVEALAAPRLVEYWEQDPCDREGTIGLGNTGLIGRGRGGGGSGSGYGRGSGAPVVVVEAEFAVGEYEVVILSATESNGLDSWLRSHGYRIPEGAEPLLRPYVAQGMKFFVAKVNPKKVQFDKQGRAQLSPLRFHYDSDDFSLPIRLGLINAPDPKSGGKQDLLVHVLAPHQRYEVANYPNVTIPTNLNVADATRERFGQFYVSLLDHTLAQSPGAVVTEYSWGATKCDPCPGPDAALTAKELAELGADVMGDQGPSAPSTPAQMSPVIRQGKAMVKGPMDRDIIRRIVRAHINELRHCYSLGLANDPKLRGEIELGFEIDEEGRTRGAELLRTTVKDKRVEACSVAALKRWKFPKPRGGATVSVRYPLELEGQAATAGRGFGGFGVSASPYVLTRLHARYDAASLGEDLVFKAVDPIAGGREFDDSDGQLKNDASPSSLNNFQGRYAIRHPWTGQIKCAEPQRGIWGSAPEGQEERDKPLVARELTKVDRGASLTSFITVEAAAKLGLGGGAAAGAGGSPEAAQVPDNAAEEADPQTAAAEERTRGAGGDVVISARGEQPPGCACATDNHRGSAGWLASLVGFLALCLRRRRRARARRPSPAAD